VRRAAVRRRASAVAVVGAVRAAVVIVPVDSSGW